MSVRKKTFNILSTAFLVLSLIVAGGLTANVLGPQDAEANVNAQNDMEICSNTLPPVYCGGFEANCYCGIVVTPEEEKK